MNNYIYKVVYQPENRQVLLTKEYTDIKEIQDDFKITKEQIKNFGEKIIVLKARLNMLKSLEQTFLWRLKIFYLQKIVNF